MQKMHLHGQDMMLVRVHGKKCAVRSMLEDGGDCLFPLVGYKFSCLGPLSPFIS